MFYYKSSPFGTLEPFLIGVLSFGGKSCGVKKFEPDVFTSVGFFRKWIEEKKKL